MLQGRITVAILYVVEHGVSLTECAARRVLPRQTHPCSLADETCKCQGFGGGPIQGLLATRHLSAQFQPFLNFWMWMKILRNRAQTLQPLRKFRLFDAGLHLVRWLRPANVWRPNPMRLLSGLA